MNAQSGVAALALLLAPPAAQEAAIRGGGQVAIGGESYGFTPLSLNLAAAAPGSKGARAFQLKGELRKEGPPIEFELTGLQPGRIYMLKLQRRTRNGLDVWAATLKTEMRIETFEPVLGGRLQLRLSGPLTGAVGGQTVHTAWKGGIWATFSGAPER